MMLLLALLDHQPGLPAFVVTLPALCILAATAGVFLVVTCLKVLFRSHLIGRGAGRGPCAAP